LLAEIPRRFARLQRAHGRWGLAYLESLLRAADYAASVMSQKRLYMKAGVDFDEACLLLPRSL